jgi:hypothetical protein
VKTGPDGVKIYGLTGLSLHLFEFDPSAGRFGVMRDVGLLMGEEKFEAINEVPQGKSIAFGPDGYAYIGMNVGGGEFPEVHMMRVHPESLDAEDYGRMESPACSFTLSRTPAPGMMGRLSVAPWGLPQPFACSTSQLPASILPDQEAELAPYQLTPGAGWATRNYAKIWS